jgi:hypothetical protein
MRGYDLSGHNFRDAVRRYAHKPIKTEVNNLSQPSPVTVTGVMSVQPKPKRKPWP